MATTSTDSPACPICGEPLNAKPWVLENKDASRYDCKTCGTFEACDLDLSDALFDSSRYLVRAWIRRYNKMGVKYPIVGGSDGNSSNWYKSLLNLGFPSTPIEKADALLKLYSDLIAQQFDNKYDAIIKVNLYPFVLAEAAAKNMNEISGLNGILSQLDYIDSGHDGQHVQMKAKGWARLDELRRVSESNDSAFIAMWFASCTEKYRNAATTAITHCGYKPVIVDQQEFNGFIMDQVISLIRQACFVIADFTCRAESDKANHKIIQGVRGGVYWEAGLAFGMGKPVIQTCENNEESKKRIHFDLDQYNTIFWEPNQLDVSIRALDSRIINPNFTEKLAQRILSTVGKGKYISP